MTQTQSSLIYVVIGSSLLALIFAVFLAKWVLSRSRGTPEMQKISNAIQQGGRRGVGGRPLRSPYRDV